MPSYQLGLDMRSAVPGRAGRPTDLLRPAGHTIARGRSTKPQPNSRDRARPSSGDTCPASQQVRGEDEERDEGRTAEEEAVLQLPQMKTKNVGGGRSVAVSIGLYRLAWRTD